MRKSLGIDQLLDDVIASLGKVEAVYVLDDYAQGKDSGLIDLLVVGDVDRVRLNELASIAERKIKRKVRVMDVTAEDFARTGDVFLKRSHWKVV